MIKIKNLTKMYTDTVSKVALYDINLEIIDKGLVSIIGPSGCGKTTLLNIGTLN